MGPERAPIWAPRARASTCSFSGPAADRVTDLRKLSWRRTQPRAIVAGSTFGGAPYDAPRAPSEPLKTPLER
eukprot:631385-Pyramimonas_sp.AAC.1